MGYEQVEDREPFCFLAEAVSGQQNQWRQSHWERSHVHQQRAATVLRMAATTLRESDSYLGAQFRRFRTRLGPPVATKAMAAKLARLVYRMLCHGMKYVDQGAQFYEAQHRKHQVIHLKRKAAQLGFQIIEVAAAA